MLYASDLKLFFGSRPILDGLNFSLLKNERIALVGHNGVGKSTLLKVIAQELEPDSGLIEKAKGSKLGYLKQVPDFDEELSVFETVKLAMKDQVEAIIEHGNLCQKLASDDSQSSDLLAKIDELNQFIESKGGFDLDYLIDSVISRLGIKDKQQKLGSMSGGEKRRVDLARILLSSPDLYLLDEPTNHLDFSAINFLINFFKNSTAALLFVSHDRAFIDQVATKIFELDKGKLFSHEPPFANYLENKLTRDLIDERSLHRQERLMVNELAWLRAGTPARTTKQNARIERAYQLMDNIAKDNEATKKRRIEAVNAEAKRLGGTILELDRVGAKIGERVLFKELSLKIKPGFRLGIIGPNGVGKSTLLSIIAKEREPDFGELKWGKNTEILKFDQHREQLEPENTLKETLADQGDYVFIGDNKIHIASYLEKYLFDPSDARRKVATLSGGEQNRLLLARLFKSPANCWLLDEPTNDLDLSSLSVIEEIILDFTGVVFVVSHDQSFLDRICTHIINFELDLGSKESTLSIHNGNYSDFLKRHESKSPEPIENKAPKKPSRVREKPVKRSFKEERELSEISGKIESLEKEQAQIHVEMNEPDFYKDNLVSQEKLARLALVEKDIEQLYERWQELENKS